MKTPKKRLVGFFMILFLSINLLQAQSRAPQAQLNDDFSITLTKDTKLSASYEADFSHLSYFMSTEAKAKTYLKNYEKQWIKISLDFDNQKAKIELEKNSTTKEWTLSQWNNHLRSK